MTVRVGIAGASGYAGGEVLRLVAAHPEFDPVVVTAQSQAGATVSQVHPHLRSVGGLTFAETTPDLLAEAELVFLALPHGAAAALAAALPDSVRVIDLGPDHRLTDPASHARYYGGAWQPAWTYGLPELPGQRERVAASRRVANTGCHAAAAILSIAPLVAAGLAEPADVVVTSISGTSGAGRAALPHLLGSEVMGDVSGYKVGVHRHVPEILQASGATSLTMVPVLAPLPRGILSSVALRPARPVDEPVLRTVLNEAYLDSPFVHVLAAGEQPHTAATLGSNSAHLQAVTDADSGRIIVTCALDNLGKGAAGQAVQLANLMCGLPETAGLPIDGTAP